MENFGEWINQELKKRGWTQADLARASGRDSAVISNVFNGRRGVGIEVCRDIAEALKLPPTTVMRAAGLLPPEEKVTEELEELNLLYRSMNSERREELLTYARFLLNEKKKRE